MMRFLTLIAIAALVACEAPPGAGGSASPTRGWEADEEMSRLGKTDCLRAPPPPDHPARMKWERTCQKDND